jgi:hypothetical protein
MAGARDRASEVTFDPATRRLCPDDTCIGLVGPDGRCKVCGAVSPEGPTAAVDGDAPRAADVEADPLGDAAEETGPRDGDEAFDPESRILCPEDTCTGLVGPNGRCKVCGKSASG